MGADGRNVKSISQSRNISAFVPAWSTVFRSEADTSGGLETLRQLSGLLTDGGRRKKREIDFAIPKHIGIRARVEYGFQRINHRIGERGAIQRRQPRRCGSNHWRPPRNRVRENPETRPAKSPRAPAAATPSLYFPTLTPQVSSDPIFRHSCGAAHPERAYFFCLFSRSEEHTSELQSLRH